MSIWSNVRYPKSVDADAVIPDSNKDSVAKNLGIVVFFIIQVDTNYKPYYVNQESKDNKKHI